MIVHHRQRNIAKFVPSLILNNYAIERVYAFNFLGILIDEHLNWNAHTQKISNKISRSLGVMCRLKIILPTHILRILYNSLVLPHLQYAILTRGVKTNRLSKLQKRAVRIITASKYNSHTEPLFKQLNLMTLNDIFMSNALKFYYKYENGSLPQYFNNMFPKTASHSYNTRGHFETRTPRVFTSSSKKCLRYFVPEILQKTTHLILDKMRTHSYHGYSQYIKRLAINKYETVCQIPDCYICNQRR